ncbi:LysR family transcriptional regulator, partial [Escherichia coli]
MKREEIADLMAFVVVAEERSFTRAAARLSMAQSALSQIVRRIEERLGLRLLTRTTRSVVPTEAGEHLLSVLGPMLHDIDSAMASLSDLQNRPSGTIRITTVEHAAKTILLPAGFAPIFPDICYHLTHYKPAAADIPVASDNP